LSLRSNNLCSNIVLVCFGKTADWFQCVSALKLLFFYPIVSFNFLYLLTNASWNNVPIKSSTNKKIRKMVSHVSRDILKYSGTLTSVHSRSPLKGGGSFNGSLSCHLFRIRDARPMTWYVCLRPVSLSHLALIRHHKTK
jgi:hypothetical protein